MANIGLHYGILMDQGKRIDLESTLNMTHIASLEAPKKPTDLGTIDMWAYKRKQETPWMTMDNLMGTNTMYVDDGWLTYSVPAMRDGSTRIVQDLSGDDQAGRGKTEFELEVSGSWLSVGQIFKFDFMTRDEFEVVSYRESGKNQVLSVRRTDSNDPVNKMWLEPGTIILSLGVSFKSPEFGQEFADFKMDISGGPKYIIPVGQKEVQVHYQVTKEVAQLDYGGAKFTVSGAQKKAMDDAIEYYFKVPGLDDNGLTTLSQALNTDKAGFITEQRDSGNVKIAISTLYDSLAVKYLNRGEQQYMVWGTGGSVASHGGMDETLAPVGAWQQLDTGFKTTFNIPDFGLHTLKAMYQEYIHGKIDYPVYGAEPVLDIQTGKAGLDMVREMIRREVNNSAIQVDAKDFGSITGSGPANLQYSELAFTSIRVFGLAIFRFTYNAAFDPMEANPQTNPILPGGYRLSSYSMIVYPENSFGNGNIKILRHSDNGGKIFMNVVNGLGVGHPLASDTKVMNGITMTTASSLKSGYKAYFMKKLDSLWVVDPTRILKAVAINPKTKKTF